VKRLSRRTEADQGGRESGNHDGESTFPHGFVDDGNGEGTEGGWESTDADVWNVSSRVAVANGLELESAVKANEPAGGCVQHLGQRWMDVKVVFPEQVIARKLSEMDLVEAEECIRVCKTAKRGCKNTTYTTWSGWLSL